MWENINHHFAILSIHQNAILEPWRARRRGLKAADDPKYLQSDLMAVIASKRGIPFVGKPVAFPDLGWIAPSQQPLRHREQLPLAVYIIEDEIDQFGPAARIVLDLGYQDRLAHGVAYCLGGGGADLFRMRQQLAV